MPLLFQVNGVHRLDRIHRRRILSFKGRKIMGSQQDLRAGHHRLPVQGLADKPGVPQLKGVVHAAVYDRIAVMLSFIVVTHAECIGHFLCRQHGDFPGQIPFHGIGNLLGRNRPFAVEVDDLPAGMDAGVGTGCAVNRNRRLENRR